MMTPVTIVMTLVTVAVSIVDRSTVHSCPMPQKVAGSPSRWLLKIAAPVKTPVTPAGAG
jgi:hypothetical protein